MSETVRGPELRTLGMVPTRACPPQRCRAAWVVSALTLVALCLQADQVGAVTCLPWSGATSLQSALDQNVCTEIQPGVYTVNAYLLIPDGHTLQGNPTQPRNTMVVKPGGMWNGNGFEGVINGTQPPHAAPSVLRHFTVDGSGLSTGGAGASDMVVDDMTIRGGRCWGVAIVGPNMTVTNSLITANGADPSCPSPPGAGIYVAANQVAYGDYAPKIHDNEIAGNTGPGVDIYNVWRGDLTSNNIHDNSGWAGVSLLGSYWTIASNTISHPMPGGGQPWIPSCSTGPSGSRPAAIFLCRDTAASGLTTAYNTITGNRASSFYGILLIGNDEKGSSAVPRNNTLSGNTLTASIQCADDNKRTGPTANTWVGCQPVYF